MKRLVLAFSLLLAAFAHADSLEQNVQAIEKAAADIKNAIQAKGGEMSGGLTNAADAIIAIPDKSNFEQTYIAWTNATIVTKVVDEVSESFNLVPWLQADGTQEILLDGIRASQDTCCSLSLRDYVTESSTAGIIGNTDDGGKRWGLHRYSSAVSFPYGGNWNDGRHATQASMDIQTKTNQFWFGGALMSAVPAQTFVTAGYLGVFRTHNWDEGVKGKLLFMELDNAVTSDGNAKMTLLPAVDTNGVPCLVDIAWKAGSTRPYAFYNIRGNQLAASDPTNTFKVIVVEHQVFTVNALDCYETTITNTPLNHLTIDDATRYLYQTMSEGL